MAVDSAPSRGLTLLFLPPPDSPSLKERGREKGEITTFSGKASPTPHYAHAQGQHYQW